ncbi:MAG: hypothetical protein EHM70_19710, partial [Chloroflexota bacterium]
MACLASEYIQRLSDLQCAPLERIHYEHQLFWLKRLDALQDELANDRFKAYHFGGAHPQDRRSSGESWLAVTIQKLRGLSLYADSIWLDDLTGQFLARLKSTPVDARAALWEQVKGAIRAQVALKEWAVPGIVSFLPDDRFLRKIFRESDFRLLDAISREQETFSEVQSSKMDLPDGAPAPSPISAQGPGRDYQVNKALLLAERFRLALSPGEGLVQFTCEKFNQEHALTGALRKPFTLSQARLDYRVADDGLLLEM